MHTNTSGKELTKSGMNSSSSRMSDNSDTATKPLLFYHHDMYGGVRIDSDNQKYELHEFEQRLRNSLDLWIETKVGGVWMKISLNHAHLVPICANHGLDFHHAQPGYVMMTKWLLADRRNMLPYYANQYLGCAGLVVNERNEVLVVKERYSSAQAKWKLPGGHANTGEDMGDAAVRETLEETGVQCEFISLLCIRHMHGYHYGLSDLYAVCLLKPLTEVISMDDSELSDCRWMDIDEWLGGDVTGINRFSGELYREVGRGERMPLTAAKVPSWNNERYNTVYAARRLTDLAENNK